MAHVPTSPRLPIREASDPAPYVIAHIALDGELSPDSPFHNIHQAWARRRTGDTPPAWDTFEFTDFRDWHSRLIISVFRDDEPDPEIRITGEAWQVVGPTNLKGLTFSQLFPRLYERQFRAHFAEIRERPLIGLCRGPLAAVDRDFVHVQVLELPVARFGYRVGGLIHCLHIDE